MQILTLLPKSEVSVGGRYNALLFGTYSFDLNQPCTVYCEGEPYTGVVHFWSEHVFRHLPSTAFNNTSNRNVTSYAEAFHFLSDISVNFFSELDVVTLVDFSITGKQTSEVGEK